MIYLLTYAGFMTDKSSLTLICTGLAAIFAGIGSASMWIVSGKYIRVACDINRVKEQAGRYYGIFGSIMACNFFIGAILSASALGYLSEKHNIYLILAFVALIGVAYCKFLIIDP